MAIEQLAKSGQAGKTVQWEQALNRLFINFRDYSKDALKTYNVEDIHQARVNSRKLLTLLSILDPDHSSGLYPLFKKAQKHLGKVRDADVLIEAFKKRQNQSKEAGDKKTAELLKAVITYQKKQRKEYRHKLSNKLPRLLSKEMNTMWDDFIGEQLEPLIARRDANVVMRELEVAYEQKRKACKVIFREQDNQSEEAFEVLHELRIAAKELRYTANAASFALNQKFHAHEDIYKEIQEQLGEINDKRIWLETLNSIGREELDIGKKTWNTFTDTLKDEILEALHQNASYLSK